MRTGLTRSMRHHKGVSTNLDQLVLLLVKGANLAIAFKKW